MGQTRKITKIKIAILAVMFVLAGAGGIWLLNDASSPSGAPISTVSQETPVETQEPTDYITYQGEASKTALELLKTKAEVQTDQYDFGELVTAINGNDGDGEKYWTFYVNGEMAQGGADAYETKNDDLIEWKLQ